MGRVCISDAQPQPFPYHTVKHVLRMLPDGHELISESPMDCQLEAALDQWEKSHSFYTYEDDKYSVDQSHWLNSVYYLEPDSDDPPWIEQMLAADLAYVMVCKKRADEDMKWFYILMHDMTGWSPAWLTANWLNS